MHVRASTLHGDSTDARVPRRVRRLESRHLASRRRKESFATLFNARSNARRLRATHRPREPSSFAA
ncbi:hypothetical protein BE221DRAFT_206982 [Ostreococcus tauri]|uniref:Uncharacterized protein n=1 Tax=Ostreococcus tauri TaxID=70448 RepID=A0A1Y5I6I5_OSTTA|nr:hypothetical protein BE221DRAFT_206982 [Ostreococcus tauri]